MFSIEGKLVRENGEARGRVEVSGETGMIERVGEETGKADLFLHEELVFPGFGDVHVHAREDANGRQNYKEDFQTLGQAALHGGVCFVADMPNNSAPPVDEASYTKKQELAAACPVSVLLYAAIGPQTKPLSMRIPYKVFMGPSVGNLFFRNFSGLENVIARYREQAVSFHCENPKMITESARPPEAEISAIEFALKLIEAYGLQGKICHCSTRAGVENIARAKQRGVRVTCEVTPHHLYFESPSTAFRVNPPIREREDRLALIEALRNGTIDYLACDHAPHTKEERQEGIPGMPHLDTYGPFTTWLMREHGFTPQDIARVCSYNPGRFVNQFIFERYGSIEDGYTGSFTVIDPGSPERVQESELKTKCGWSPFAGVEFPGQVLYTIHKGKVLYEKNPSSR